MLSLKTKSASNLLATPKLLCRTFPKNRSSMLPCALPALNPPTPRHDQRPKPSLFEMSPRTSYKQRLSPLCQTPAKTFIPKVSDSVVASKSLGLIKSYAANTHTGMVRSSNEDRVTINYRVAKPDNKECSDWPSISYFGVFDGHGGSKCSDFLRDNLLECILEQPTFPEKPIEAIKSGFAEAERRFLILAASSFVVCDRSGSCANVALIIKDVCYIANVGDSRAILSSDRGMRLYELSQDHKPNLPTERERITRLGGKVYSNEAPKFHSSLTGSDYPIVYRVLPGRLAISRTFGDADAKLDNLGGIPGVVVAEPDVKSFRISKKHDFILIASDGVYDVLSSSDVIKTVWSSIDSSPMTFHAACAESVKKVLEEAMCRRSSDNVTAVLIAFSSLKEAFEGATQGQ